MLKREEYNTGGNLVFVIFMRYSFLILHFVPTQNILSSP